MRTGAEFATAAAERQIARWNIHDCGFCGYPCGYVFYEGSVGYDSGCDCVNYPSPVQPRTWDDVAEQYNIQTAPQVIAAYDAFWGFRAALPEETRHGE